MSQPWSFIVKKENNKLLFNDLGGYETRNPSTMWCIQEADKIYNWNDFSEIKIKTTDWETDENVFAYSKINNDKNLVPDFNFHSWPQVGINDYNEFIKEIHSNGIKNYKINKVGWIGNTNTHHFRKKLLEIGNNNKELFDFFDCGNWWVNPDCIKLNNHKYISTPDLVESYSILLDIEGCGYSGRLKHLLWSHRPVLLVDRIHKEFFFKYLKEWVHYIPVKNDLSDLIEKTKWILNNYSEALLIAENAYQFSQKYLTREACYQQWDNIISLQFLDKK